MLTMNCDEHALLKRFHKPVKDLPPDKQDKRSVVPLEIKDLSTWLGGSIEEASELIALPDETAFIAGPTV